MSEAARLPPVGMTVAEFLDWAEDTPGRWQLRDGEPEMIAPPADRHGAIQSELTARLVAHLRSVRSPCHVLLGPGVVPLLRSDRNMLIPDIGITCAPESDAVAMTDPLVLIEILSPANEKATRANIPAFMTIPSLMEIVVLWRVKIAAEILRRNSDGSWPVEADMIAADGMLRIERIGFEVPLREAYRSTRLWIDPGSPP